jgi:hypothetical protein
VDERYSLQRRHRPVSIYLNSSKSTRKEQVFLRSVRRLLVTDSVLVTPKKEALSSSETSVLTIATRRNIREDTILHSHRRENLKSYMMPMSSRSAGRTARCYIPEHITILLYTAHSETAVNMHPQVMCRYTCFCIECTASLACYGALPCPHY